MVRNLTDSKHGTKNSDNIDSNLGRFKLLNQIYSKFKKKSLFAQASEQ